MSKLRKLLGDVEWPECAALMRLIETQSKKTLASWAISYAKASYLPIFAEACPQNQRLEEIVADCEAYLAGEITLKEIKPRLQEASQIARSSIDPIAQAAARAVAVACAVIQTPTNALGFLFYGAAAVAYHQVGLEQPEDVYNDLAASELGKALASLKEASVVGEEQPVKINWHC